jgi:hypothetical protein
MVAGGNIASALDGGVVEYTPGIDTRFILPSRVPTPSATTLPKPAHIGAAIPVPFQQQSITATPLLSSPKWKPGDKELAPNAISGTSRLASAGVREVCQVGFAKIVLAPPPLAPEPSFQALSTAGFRGANDI